MMTQKATTTTTTTKTDTLINTLEKINEVVRLQPEEIANRIKDAIGVKCRFVAFDYTNKLGEESRYTLLINTTYKNLLTRNERALARMISRGHFTDTADTLAANELLNSFRQSIAGVNELANKLASHYEQTETKNCKYHKDFGTVYLQGVQCRKTTKLETIATRKKVNSSAKTIAKRRIKKILGCDKWRSFEIQNVTNTRHNGKTIDIIGKAHVVGRF
jgi:cobalamin biosynthesis protein CbiG